MTECFKLQLVKYAVLESRIKGFQIPAGTLLCCNINCAYFLAWAIRFQIPAGSASPYNLVGVALHGLAPLCSFKSPRGLFPLQLCANRSDWTRLEVSNPGEDIYPLQLEKLNRGKQGTPEFQIPIGTLFPLQQAQ